MIYTDRYGAITKLIDDENYEIIAEVYKEDGRLIAGLFEFTEEGLTRDAETRKRYANLSYHSAS
ncbi:hypothetical protein BABA_17372 [Neobacillus bataviensis LMG 21833]|uniref:Uncharacterized protein n=1 Tax=Neobacillus bataviensis LMG 21833 TaxID=1117379 RepID=K6DYV0_9BACI|nr:hypothetical protein BABA_17372 [Neobacillus bataviensis LMG 21833]